MLADLPLYLSFLATSVAMLIVALGIYVAITPVREITLIHQGNQAAAFSLGGTTIGMAYVLYTVSASTFDLLELAVWGAIGLAVQLLVFLIVSLMIPGLKRGVMEDKAAYGIILGAFSIAVGILGAGALSN